MTRTVLCFGDSNTHGTPPMAAKGAYDRYGPNVRWPGVMASALGEAWTVVADGLPGRTTAFADPVMGAHMDGRLGLRMALAAHAPLDALVIMLGTNDVKERFGATAEAITGGLATLLDIALHPDAQERSGGFEVIVVCPAPVREIGVLAAEFHGGRAKSLGLPPLYEAAAKVRGCRFVDAGALIEVSDVDGVHLDPEAHAQLGRAVAQLLT